MSDPKELCEVCKQAELTGSVFLMRLRTPKEGERVTPGRNTCDGCANLIMAFLRLPNLLQRLKDASQ